MIRRRPRVVDDQAAAPEPPRVGLDVGQLRLDVSHRITHTYEARPKPPAVQLQLRDSTGAQIRHYIASYPGHQLTVPRYLLDQMLADGADLEIICSW